MYGFMLTVSQAAPAESACGLGIVSGRAFMFFNYFTVNLHHGVGFMKSFFFILIIRILQFIAFFLKGHC